MVTGKIQEKHKNTTFYISPALDEALLNLEDICVRFSDGIFTAGDDPERINIQQRFKNIVTPISLALAEVRGPRRFHHHYRHDSRNSDVLLPVMENPIETLANACKNAIKESSKKLVGIHDTDVLKAQRILERSLNNFLFAYNKQEKDT